MLKIEGYTQVLVVSYGGFCHTLDEMMCYAFILEVHFSFAFVGGKLQC